MANVRDVPPDQSSLRMGRFVSTSFGDETVRAYVPPALPPEPPVELGGLLPLIEQANRAFGVWTGVRQSFLRRHSSSLCTCARKRCCPLRSRERNLRFPTCCCSR